MASSAILGTSVAKKYWMALTGLFLCLFLAGHLAGNLQLLIPVEQGARDQFNEYALFMTTNPLVKILSYATYISILFHSFDGILLWWLNRKARPRRYIRNNPKTNSKWASRNMAFLGTVLLIFIILHMGAFWAQMKFGALDDTIYTTTSGERVKDLYTLTVKTFQDPEKGLLVSIIYGISMIALGFHLSHGFSSAFQSLGLYHKKYNPIIKFTGTAFAVLVSIGFAIIPFYIRFILDTI